MRARGRGRRSPTFELAGNENGAFGMSSSGSLQQLFRQARASGVLNLTTRDLEEIPTEVFNLIGEKSFQRAHSLMKRNIRTVSKRTA